ncbi:MAG: glycosyltransferase family 2 protein [Lachnospiraceae bacterium]|jgi:glucosyltransferase|nr:glycosyltransferase family 2 protein [Lachnospiraceae bacterium]MCI1727526.1 glycosyltransferase family 2 protein [Lachnospiraceae bacterium]
MKLSVVIPCHNEEGNIQPLLGMFEKEFGTLMAETEFIFVNDGSRDGTLAQLKKELSRPCGRMKIVDFSRNFGKESAILAGLQNAEGDYTAIIDGDGQQNPKYIVQMLEIITKDPDIDCVAAFQNKRRENAFSRFCKSAFYRVMNRLCSVHLKEAASDFRVFNRNFRDAILSLPELCRFSKGIFSWVGYRTEYIEYQVEDRITGSTNWSFTDLMRYGFVGIVAFSTKPLEIAAVVGSLYTVVAFIATLYVFIKAMIYGDPVAGYPTIMCVLLFSFGLLFMFIGILGRYISNAYIESKKRPAYLIKHIYDSKEGTNRL